jgi:hypothetical protein
MRDLAEHLEICQKVLAIVETESHALRQPSPDLQQPFLDRKSLLPALDASINRIRSHRVEWGRRSPQERAGEPRVTALLRETQDLIMRIFVADRENEQVLLRKGLVPPRHLPHANTQRPQFVAGLYRQQNTPRTACREGSPFGPRDGP